MADIEDREQLIQEVLERIKHEGLAIFSGSFGGGGWFPTVGQESRDSDPDLKDPFAEISALLRKAVHGPNFDPRLLPDDFEVKWGKATGAWSTGNSITLDPCTAPPDEEDTGEPNVTGYIVCDIDRAITYADIVADDVVAYIPYGAALGIIVNVIHGGTATTVKDILPTGANFESETAQTDTWARDDQGANDGLTLRVCMRIAYDDASDEKLYAFYRELKYDSAGQLQNISAETRKEIDAPGLCP